MLQNFHEDLFCVKYICGLAILMKNILWDRHELRNHGVKILLYIRTYM